MISIAKERTLFDRKIENLEDRLDSLCVRYYEENDNTVSVYAIRELENVIKYLKNQITLQGMN